MGLLTPEIVERAARALLEESQREFQHRFQWDKLGERFKKRARDQARAALEAVIPSLIEEISRVVEVDDALEPGELRSCPFCGGEAEILLLTDEANLGGSCVACSDCGTNGPVHFDRKEHLEASWNERSATAIRSLIPSKEK